MIRILHTRALMMLVSAVIMIAVGGITRNTAHAQTFDLTCDDDLAATITAANGNNADDTINLEADCTYTLTQSLTIDSDNNHTLTINGNGATISGDNTVQIFLVIVGANLTLDDITLTEGKAEDVPFQGNTADGGAINVTGGTLTIDDSLITNNSANRSGGAIFVDDSFSAGEVAIRNSTLSNNSAEGTSDEDGGGAIYVADGVNTNEVTLLNSVTITNSTINNNTTSNSGGGIYLDKGTNSGGSLTITGSTISNNTAAEDGGGIFDDGGGGSLTIDTSTIVGNQANGAFGGGGIAFFQVGETNIISTTIAYNTAVTNGGGMHNQNAERVVNLTNTIVSGNTATTGFDLNGTFNSQDFNFFGQLSGAVITGSTNNNLTGDPLLAASLQDNGGDTLTLEILPGSPAVDAGSCISGPDQRGLNRPIDLSGLPNAGNGCDIGAFERENTPPIANNDSFNVPRASESTINAPGVLANDSDPDNDTLQASLVSQVSNGSITLNQNGSFTYTPPQNPPETVTFTYKVSDGNADSNTATVTLTLINNPPVAADDNYTITADTQLTLSAPGILINDSDSDGEPLTATKTSDPSNGTATVSPDGGISYTPNTGFVGTDSFTYSASDGAAQSNTATVTITVIAPIPDQLTLIAPQGILTNGGGNPLYQWNDRGANIYEIYLGTSSGRRLFYDRLASSQYCDGTLCQVDLTDLTPSAWLANGSYIVYLCTSNCGVASGWRGPFTFALNIPQATAPVLLDTTNTNSLTPTLNWTLPQGATDVSWFQLYLAPTNDIQNEVLFSWVTREEACGSWTSTACAYQVPVSLMSNTFYTVYIRSWGPFGFSFGQFVHWNGPEEFTTTP